MCARAREAYRATVAAPILRVSVARRRSTISEAACQVQQSSILRIPRKSPGWRSATEWWHAGIDSSSDAHGPATESLRRQWFEGWFFRLVDHSSKSSVAVIFGSLRRPQEQRQSVGPFDEHLVVVSYDDERDGSHHMRSVKLDGDAVTLRGRSAGGFEVAAVDGASGGGGGGGGGEFSWWSERHGGMRVKGDDALLDLRFSHGLRLVANISSPRPLGLEPTKRSGPRGVAIAHRAASVPLLVHPLAHPRATPYGTAAAKPTEVEG